MALVLNQGEAIGQAVPADTARRDDGGQGEQDTVHGDHLGFMAAQVCQGSAEHNDIRYRPRPLPLVIVHQ